MNGFLRYPSTHYLIAPEGREIREDKAFDEDQRARFLKSPVIVEEKVDGQNLGISVEGEQLRFQSRGSYVELGGRHFQGLEAWAQHRASRITRVIGADLILFGEWMTIVHSIRYQSLPDWFLMFDVFDRSSGSFWPVSARDGIADELGFPTVPRLGEGVYGLDELRILSQRESVYGRGAMEGVVLRSLDEGIRPSRAKLVRSGFIQQIGEHWTRGALERNRLASL